MGLSKVVDGEMRRVVRTKRPGWTCRIDEAIITVEGEPEPFISCQTYERPGLFGGGRYKWVHKQWACPTPQERVEWENDQRRREVARARRRTNRWYRRLWYRLFSTTKHLEAEVKR